MKKMMSVLIAASLLPTLSFAMPDTQKHEGHKGHSNYMNHKMRCGGMMGDNHMGAMKNMNLTPEQRQKIRKLRFEQMETRHEIMHKYYDKLSDADRQAMEQELNKLKETNRQNVQAVLTKEQQKQIAEKKAQREQHRKEWQEFQEWKAKKAK